MTVETQYLPTLQGLLRLAAVAFGVPQGAPESSTRTREVVNARFAFCHAALARYGYRVMDVAAAIGRHHSTAIYAREQHPGRMQSDPHYRAGYERLTLILDRTRDVLEITLR